ncbi:placental prolactin-related protein 3-like [Muntiacus reevesi]|uniref:placental prolactin-related protein 3-like n=1 Tax=Muntiacus reevesi TaxID=9886 RepID=UPI003306F4BB
MEKEIALLHRQLNPTFMASWLSLRSIRCSRLPPSHPIRLTAHGQQESLPWDHSAIPMALAPSFHGNQWTYNPVRGMKGSIMACLCGSHYVQTVTALGARSPRSGHQQGEVLDKKYSQSKPEYINSTNDCHSDPLHAPEEREKAQQMNNEDLSKWILKLQYLWIAPLFDIGADREVGKDLSRIIISSASKSMILPVWRKLSEDRMYWSGYQSLVSSDEDVRHSALYNLFKRRRKDSRKVDKYSKILACRIHNVC